MRLGRTARRAQHGQTGHACVCPVTYGRCDAAAIVETIGVYPLVVVWPDLANRSGQSVRSLSDAMQF